ncbi:DNA polymerase [Actinacidiphila paucisporea]|uniref:DNA-directed DNA polymerase n=1 Tax=Actinacidiphila paucisporea TaxID=310782 RepID=A0A1M6TFR6_9ACTN|nr:DNA polymerase [Actinacidiphila paucisporea]SHK55709.1 DNA polymerase-1 [Actinacidiphila paucisporea]
MTAYTRTHGGVAMTVHAPADDAEFDQAAFAAFAASDPVLGLDVEGHAIVDGGPGHFGPDAGLRMVQFGTATTAWVLNPLFPGQRLAIEAVLADPERRFTTHTNYDTLAVWSAFGIALGQRVIDTHLLSKLVDPDERAGHGLKDLSLRYLDSGLVEAQQALYARMRELAPTGRRAGNSPLTWGWNHIPATDEAYTVYAGLDAVYVRRLLPVLLARCGPFSHLVRMEQWLAAQSTGITVRGLLLDRPYTESLLERVQDEFDQAAGTITRALGFSGSSPRFAEWLEQQVTGTRLPRTDGGRPSATADALTQLTAEIADGTATITEQGQALLEARRAMAATTNTIANLKSFLTAADGGGRVHPQINTLRARTGRMSITGPALQTLKKHDPRLRHCFQADPGNVLITCDFSQVEVRVAAALSRDRTLMAVIASGVDIHDATAELMYGKGFAKEQRTVSKRATFGTIYGGGAKALAAQTGVPVSVARGVIQRWQRTYPEVIRFGKDIANATTVITGSGRRIPADPARPYANSNYAIQSTARDLLVAAVYQLATEGGLHGALWLFVHDEVIVQAPAHRAEEVRRLLQEAMTATFRGVPIAADAEILGTHWGRLPDTTSTDTTTGSVHAAA